LVGRIIVRVHPSACTFIIMYARYRWGAGTVSVISEPGTMGGLKSGLEGLCTPPYGTRTVLPWGKVRNSLASELRR